MVLANSKMVLANSKMLSADSKIVSASGERDALFPVPWIDVTDYAISGAVT